MIHRVELSLGVREGERVGQHTRSTAKISDLQAVALFRIQQTLVRDKPTKQRNQGKVSQSRRRFDLEVIVIVRQRRWLEIHVFISQKLGFL